MVIAVIVAIGICVAGWAVLRARPTALAAPQEGSPAASAAAGAASPTTPRSAGQGTAAQHGSSGKTDAAAGSEPTGTSSSPTATIKVHVTGAVSKPGVLTLRQGARIEDALEKAGGTTHRAVLGHVNLAQPVADGQQLVVAKRGQSGKPKHKTRIKNPPPDAGAAPSEDASGSGSENSATENGSSEAGAAAPKTKVDLNSATQSELEDLSGVGPVTAKKIIEWRKQNQKFTSVKELQEVDGIGPKRFADLSGNVTVQ